MRKLILFTFFLVFYFQANAQLSRLKRATDAMADLDYMTAIVLFQQVLQDEDNPEAKINLAECYRKINDTENAEYWYGQVTRLPEARPIHKLYYGMMLQANNKCDLAKMWLLQYQKEVPDDARGQFLARACDMREELLNKNKGIYVISRMPFNSKYDDFAPALFNNKVIFASDREVGSAIKRTNMWTGNPFAQLFSVPFGIGGVQPGDFTYARAEKFSKDLNSKFHEAAVSFSPDQKTIYFTRNNYFDGKKGKSDEGLVKLKIYYGKAGSNGDWNVEGGLPFNSDEYNVAHPSISIDGKRLYFSSNKPGGFGGMDLYFSDLQGTIWGPPINLGPVVNTEGNEIFPFVDINNRLYFSSNGHIGLGGLDQYYTTPGEGKAWNLPVNLGAPINSGNDDFGIIFGPTGEWGYFSSDRDHGVGGDDIYGFQKSASPVEVYVYDPQTNQPLSGAAVSNSLTGVNMMTGPDGKIAFDMRLTDCTDFSVQKKGYENNMKNACATASTPGQLTRVEIALQKQANYIVQGIVFDMMNGMPAEGAQVMITNDCGKPIPALVTTRGDGRFKFKLDKECCYSIRAVKDGYIADIQSDICTKGVAKNTTLKSSLSLQPYRDSEGFAIAPAEKDKSIQGPKFNLESGLYTNPNGSLATFELGEGLHVKDGILYDSGTISKPTQGDWERGTMGYVVDVYHDYDQSTLREESMTDLEKLYKTLRENPEISIQISSHTDSRGTDDYNILLSQRRADAVVDWLVQKGISKDRITGKGYGESKPVNACSDEATCPEEMHKLNRRTEFSIIGMRPSPTKAKTASCDGCPF